MKSILLRDVELAKDEELKDSTVVWAFDFRYLWITLVALTVLYFIRINLWFKLPLLLVILYYGNHTFRQNWKLSLTNRRLIARRIYPSPLSYFLSRIHNFPYQHLEGISTGPRNNILFFILGLAIASNLGLNLLKSSLSASTLELPDTLEFILFVAILLPPFSNRGAQIERDLQDWYQQFAQDVLITTGVIALITGILLMLISFPWKQFLVLRIRYAKDFKLRTSIPNEFIAKLSEHFYESEVVKPPEKYKKWHFPWLKNEKVDGVADMEQINYLTRLVGVFALLTGIIRVWIGLSEVDSYTSPEFILWIAVTVIDWIIIFFSIRYSKLSSEFLITNKRIIFAQEVKQMSGLVGRRYFFISDLKRHDIASFEFRRITAFAIEYLLSAVLATYITLLLLRTDAAFLAVPFLFFSIFLFIFVYQTFVSFNIRTKSGDRWVMRHQLANPTTRMRQFIGDEGTIFSRLLANRLEEKKIINVVQKLRSRDIGLKAKNFEKVIQESIENLESDHVTLKDEFSKKRFTMKRKSLRRRRIRQRNIKRKRIQLTLDDILLQDEEIIWEKVIPNPLNHKFLTMTLASLGFILAMPTIFFFSVNYTIDIEANDFHFEPLSGGLFGICMILSIILYLLLQLKYFTLRRKSLVITESRVFYEEIVRPPKWLFFIGVFRESYIREALIHQLQTISSGKYKTVSRHWEEFKVYLRSTLFQTGLWIGLLYLELLTNSVWKDQMLSSEISNVVQFAMLLLGIAITWSFSNLIVHLIQSWPTLELNASGIGVDFSLPYLTQSQSEHAQYALWTGIGPEELMQRRVEKRIERRKKKMKKEMKQ